MNSSILLEGYYRDSMVDDLINPEDHIENNNLEDSFIMSLGEFVEKNPEYSGLIVTNNKFNVGDSVLHIHDDLPCTILYMDENILIRFDNEEIALVSRSSIIPNMKKNKLSSSDIKNLYSGIREIYLLKNPINKSILSYYSAFIDYFDMNSKLLYDSLNGSDQVLLMEELEKSTNIFSSKSKYNNDRKNTPHR